MNTTSNAHIADALAKYEVAKTAALSTFNQKANHIKQAGVKDVEAATRHDEAAQLGNLEDKLNS